MFAKLDLGAFGSSGEIKDEDGSVALVAGEPIIDLRDHGARDRLTDLRLIFSSVKDGGLDELRAARGAYCSAIFNAGNNTLTLITDKLGIRPIYYWSDDQFVIFSSALRVLEQLPIVPKRMDVRAVTEIAGLGYALGDRTPYKDISVLKAGEMIRVDREDITRNIYWNWDRIEVSTKEIDHLLGDLYRRFREAVSLRLRSDTSAVAYLSGGLDSRCVVATLCDLGSHVHTFNFARPNTQDLIFGGLFAEQVNVTHTELPKKAGDHRPDYSEVMKNAWSTASLQVIDLPERPNVAWSGEGGSVVLGHVHLNETILDHMRAGKIDDAIAEFSKREWAFVPHSLLQAESQAEIDGFIPNGIREELKTRSSKDPARSFYLFLVLNDQRRKMAGHFENIDLNRLELQIPFFDSSFVELIVSLPVDICLKHQLYVKWLGQFQPAVSEVPWQAYPGHVPCPLPVPPGLSYQWESAYRNEEQRSIKKELRRQAMAITGARNFASKILRKNAIRAAALVHLLGIRDYSYIIETAEVFQKYWTICNGDIVL